ncbi:MAG TPA: hypothetical protein P5571_02145 [Candidatus Krumholzibacteria bacterium]|nr:hypothetical protein [Candidatus Krumholzibacteria bacterium]HRX50150.1 hypothetical protein [Candidatus Krumholzibacteria bacterium]
MPHAIAPRPAILLAALLFLATSAGAVTWGGELGVVHLSFQPAPDVQPVLEQEPAQGLGLLVDVYAVMMDMDPVRYRGERVLAAGGYEMRLRVEGAEGAQVLGKEIPVNNLDVAPDNAGIICGLQPDITFQDKGVVLAKWRVRIPGDNPKPVSFHLDPEGAVSHRGVAGAEDAAPYMLWTGSLQNRQHGLMCAAGYVPAWLNPEGEPDLTPRHAKVSWRDTGLFTLPE